MGQKTKKTFADTIKNYDFFDFENMDIFKTLPPLTQYYVRLLEGNNEDNTYIKTKQNISTQLKDAMLKMSPLNEDDTEGLTPLLKKIKETILLKYLKKIEDSATIKQKQEQKIADNNKAKIAANKAEIASLNNAKITANTAKIKRNETKIASLDTQIAESTNTQEDPPDIQNLLNNYNTLEGIDKTLTEIKQLESNYDYIYRAWNSSSTRSRKL